MDTLADLEDVFCERRIDNEYFPSTRHEHWSEEGGDEEDDTNVENNQVSWVAAKKPRHHLLLEKEKAKSITEYKYAL